MTLQRSVFSLLLSFIMLAACSYFPFGHRAEARLASEATKTGKVPGPLVVFAGERATASERTDCTAKGGRVERAGLLGWERCTRLFTDGGKVCTDSSQCEGQCRADLAANRPGDRIGGQCTATDNPFGCYAIVENGATAGVLCVD